MTTARKYAIAMTAALGLIMGILDNTIVNIALIPISVDLKVDLGTVQWLVTGYFLSQAAVIPVAGYLGNRLGTRRMFMFCVAFFTIGSLLCGIAQDANLLIIFRIIQGIGAGALFPLGQTLALDPFAPHERAKATALIVIPVLLGPVLGPILGGWINDSFGWHYLFLINVPIGFLTVFLTWRIMPADKLEEADTGKFDYIGLALSTIGVVAIVYAFTIVNNTDPSSPKTPLNPNGSTYGWGYWLTWTLFGIGVVLLGIFSVYELRLSDPILDLRLFKKYSYTIASIVTWVVGATVFGALILLPVFLQQIRIPHLSALDTGLALAPQGIGAILGVAISGPLFNKLGVRIITGAGAIAVMIALWQFGQSTATSDGWTLAPWNLVLGVGLGLTFIPSQTLAFLSLTGPALAKASSLFNVTRQITSSVATAITITLLGQQTTHYIVQLQADALSKLPAGTPPPTTMDPAMAQQLGSQGATLAVNDVFIYLAVASVLVLLLSFVMPSLKRMSELQSEQQEQVGAGRSEALPVHVG
jgi:EmrB/QacA subfamily drug resistance transporter